MSTTFHPDEVPERLKVAASECQSVRMDADRKLLGGLCPHELPAWPSLPPPLLDGQRLDQPMLNPLSLQREGTTHYLAICGKWVRLGGTVLTHPLGLCIM